MLFDISRHSLVGNMKLYPDNTLLMLPFGLVILRNSKERNFGTTVAAARLFSRFFRVASPRYEKVEEIKKQLETKKEEQPLTN